MRFCITLSFFALRAAILADNKLCHLCIRFFYIYRILKPLFISPHISIPLPMAIFQFPSSSLGR